MKELVTQVSYLVPVKQGNGKLADEVVATFLCQRPVFDPSLWTAKIGKVSLKTAAEVIFKFFNSEYAQKASFLEVLINGQKIMLHKSGDAVTADYYLRSLAENFELE